MTQNYKNSDWRCSIIAQLREKKSIEPSCLIDIISQNVRLRRENSSIKVSMKKQTEQLNHAAEISNNNGETIKANYEIIKLKDIIKKKEIDLQNLKDDNSNWKCENLKLLNEKKDLQLLLNERTERAQNLTTKNDELEKKNIELLNSNEFLKKSWSLSREQNDSFKDKCIILQEKLRKCLDENHTYAEHIKFQKSQIESMTKNESFLLVNCPQPEISIEAKECEECISLEEFSYINISKEITCFSENYYSTPNRIYLSFDVNENEIQSVCWSPHDNMLATGGLDRQIKLWNISFAHPYNFKTLVGSSGIINSIQFNDTGSHILAACGDSAARIWNIQNQNLQATLTGHGRKVLCAKFFANSIRKAVTGSRDGTLKLWDINSLLCLNTKLVNSTCHDLVVTDTYSPSVISGHFDKKIRFWDMREEQNFSNIEMPDIITSLDISKDGNSLLCSVRNNTLNIIDLRYNNILKSFTENDFTINSNLSKACFNSLGNKISSGSGNGSVFIWSTDGLFETELNSNEKNSNRKSSINSVAWHPVNSVLATVGNSNMCNIWS